MYGLRKNWSRLAAGFGLLAGGFTVHSVIPALYHKHRNPAVLRRTGVPGTVMLTFDDGPDPEYTGRLLDLLKKEEVKAAFFVVTREAVKEEALIDRMLSEGHVVGFHSMDHQNAMVRGYLHTKKRFSHRLRIYEEKRHLRHLVPPALGAYESVFLALCEEIRDEDGSVGCDGRRLGAGSHGGLDPEEVLKPCKGWVHPLSSRWRKTHGRRTRSSGEDAGSACVCDTRVKRGGVSVYTPLGIGFRITVCRK